MKKKESYCVLFILMILIVSCSDSNVEIVKNGFFVNKKTSTIESIAKLHFSEGSWKSFSENGESKVMFTGKINKNSHDKYSERHKKTTSLTNAISYFRKNDDVKQIEGDRDNLIKKTNTEYKELYKIISEKKSEISSLINKIDDPGKSREERISDQKKYNQMYSQHDNELNKKRAENTKILNEFDEKAENYIIKKYIWPEGTEIKLIWTLFVDKKNFILSNVKANGCGDEYCSHMYSLNNVNSFLISAW